MPLGLPISLSAQCYTACGGSCTAPASYTITGTHTWPGYNYCLTSDLTISGTLNITSATCLDFAANKEIIVTSTGTLNISGSSQLYSSSAMWKGIRVRSGGILTINGATIANAFIGVYAENNNSNESIFDISATTFCNNEIGVLVESFTVAGAMASTIDDTYFTAPSLISPKSGEVGDYGIVLNSVTPATPFLIGDTYDYDDPSTTFNEFESLNVAIRTNNSNVVIQDNYIHDLIGANGTLTSLGSEPASIFQTGIYATGSGGSDHYLNVGSNVTDGYNNWIENADKGIVVSNRIDSYIWQNRITADYEEEGNFNMKVGILVENNCGVVEIKLNRVTNFEKFGVNIDDNPNADPLYIYGNIMEELVSFHPSLKPIGFNVENNTLSAPNFTMYSNESIHVLNGLVLTNIEAPEVIYNTLYYEATTNTGGAYTGHGLLASNCPEAVISNNWTYGTNGSYIPYQTGFYFEECPDLILEGNSTFTSGVGVFMTNTMTGSNMYCNKLEDADIGFYLLDIGGDAFTPPIGPVIQQPTGPGPSGNYWEPASTANRITTNESADVTNCTAVDWNYEDSGTDYDIPGGLVDPVGGILPMFNDVGGTNCLAYDDMRLSAEILVENLESQYYNWATNFNDNLVVSSPESWFLQYGFWSKVVKGNVNVELLSEELQELYSSTALSNIPLFFDLVDAISTGNFASAQTILSNVTPINEIENYWQQTSQIYLNNINIEGVFELNPEDQESLLTFATMDGKLNGPGIYQARAMLDTLLSKNNPITIEEKKFLLNEEIIITPNPASKYIYLRFTGNNLSFTDINNIQIHDVTGKIVKTVDAYTDGSIYVSDLNSGFYILQITLKSKKIITEKIIIEN